jgi:signal transduction histidine kinase
MRRLKLAWDLLRTPGAGAILAGVICLALLLPAGYFLGNWYQADLIKQERAKTAEDLSARANALAAAVDQRIALLQGLYAFTRTEWPDTAFDRPFQVYASGVYFNTTGLRTLMIAPEGIARYIFPSYDAASLSGYDVLNDPEPGTRADIQRAIHTGGITISQPGELHQGGFGLTAWEAVYRGSDLWGLVSVSIDMNTVLQDAGLTNPSSSLDMALRDRLGYTFFGSGDAWQQEPLIQAISLPEGSWELGGVPAQGWVAAVETPVRFFRFGSLLIALLVASLVYLSVNRQGRLARAVEQRTHEIVAARQQLEQRVEERTQQLSTLLDVSHRIVSTLALSPLLEQILSEIKPVLDYSSACNLQFDELGRLVEVSHTGEVLDCGSPPGSSWWDERLQEQVIIALQPLIQWDWGLNHTASVRCCWMGVPLEIKEHATGMLVFIHQDPHYYLQEHARLAMAFAQQVAVAIENARLYEQAGKLAVLEERQRLARELHDSVSQVLYSIGLGARTARALLDRDPSQAIEALDYVNRLAEAGQVEMRALIFELRPESLQTEGLVAALQKLAQVLETRHQLAVQLDLCPEPLIPIDLKETIYRIAQEATHNIIKHACASRVTLTLAWSDGQAQLEISDNGKGFDTVAAHPGHLGIRSMRERVSHWNGNIQIDSSPGMGTKIELTIPCPD